MIDQSASFIGNPNQGLIEGCALAYHTVIENVGGLERGTDFTINGQYGSPIERPVLFADGKLLVCVGKLERVYERPKAGLYVEIRLDVGSPYFKQLRNRILDEEIPLSAGAIDELVRSHRGYVSCFPFAEVQLGLSTAPRLISFERSLAHFKTAGIEMPMQMRTARHFVAVC